MRDKFGIVQWQKAYNNYRKERGLGKLLEDLEEHLSEEKYPFPEFEGTSMWTFRRYLPHDINSTNKDDKSHQQKKFRKQFIEHLKFALSIHGHTLETDVKGEPILINEKGLSILFRIFKKETDVKEKPVLIDEEGQSMLLSDFRKGPNEKELFFINEKGDFVDKEEKLVVDRAAYLKYTEKVALPEKRALPEEQNQESYNLYYWSSEKIVRHGTLKLFRSATNGLPIQGTASFEVVPVKNKPPILINDAKYFEDAGTVYVLLKRKQEDGATIYSQIIFRRKENVDDVYFATYTSATSNDKRPYSGLMLLERKMDNSENISPYLDFYKYVLFNKRIQIENSNQAISFTELDNRKKITSAYIRGWKKIKDAAGFYKGFFVVPLNPSLEACIFSVKNDSTVNIWTAAQAQPYKGSLSLEFDGDYNKKAIIKADVMLPFDDNYRLTIYLNIEEYNYKPQSEKLKRSNANTAYGLYTCYRYKNGEPFASRFACFKIAGADPISKQELENLKNEHIKSYPLKPKRNVAKAESVLRALDLYNFFKNTSKDNISLGVHV
jgi:hypothetical protein